MNKNRLTKITAVFVLFCFGQNTLDCFVLAETIDRAASQGRNGTISPGNPKPTRGVVEGKNTAAQLAGEYSYGAGAYGDPKPASSTTRKSTVSSPVSTRVSIDLSGTVAEIAMEGPQDAPAYDLFYKEAIGDPWKPLVTGIAAKNGKAIWKETIIGGQRYYQARVATNPGSARPVSLNLAAYGISALLNAAAESGDLFSEAGRKIGTYKFDTIPSSDGKFSTVLKVNYLTGRREFNPEPADEVDAFIYLVDREKTEFFFIGHSYFFANEDLNPDTDYFRLLARFVEKPLTLSQSEYNLLFAREGQPLMIQYVGFHNSFAPAYLERLLWGLSKEKQYVFPPGVQPSAGFSRFFKNFSYSQMAEFVLRLKPAWGSLSLSVKKNILYELNSASFTGYQTGAQNLTSVPGLERLLVDYIREAAKTYPNPQGYEEYVLKDALNAVLNLTLSCQYGEALPEMRKAAQPIFERLLSSVEAIERLHDTSDIKVYSEYLANVYRMEKDFVPGVLFSVYPSEIRDLMARAAPYLMKIVNAPAGTLFKNLQLTGLEEDIRGRAAIAVSYCAQNPGTAAVIFDFFYRRAAASPSFGMFSDFHFLREIIGYAGPVQGKVLSGEITPEFRNLLLELISDERASVSDKNNMQGLYSSALRETSLEMVGQEEISTLFGMFSRAITHFPDSSLETLTNRIFAVSMMYALFGKAAFDLSEESPVRSWIIDEWKKIFDEVPESNLRSALVAFYYPYDNLKAFGLLARTDADVQKVVDALRLSGAQEDIYRRNRILVLNEDTDFTARDFENIKQWLLFYPEPLIFNLGLITRTNIRTRVNFGEHAEADTINLFGPAGTWHYINIRFFQSPEKFEVDHEIMHALDSEISRPYFLPEKRWIRKKMFDLGASPDRPANGRGVNQDSKENSAEFGRFYKEDTLAFLDQWVTAAKVGRFNGLRMLLSMMGIFVYNSGGNRLPVYQGLLVDSVPAELDAANNLTSIDIPKQDRRYRFTYTFDGLHILTMTVESLSTGKILEVTTNPAGVEHQKSQ